MTRRALPSEDEMLAALMGRDPSYEGVFWTGVRSTGVFCRPTCPARKPRPENVEFFGSTAEALLAGYRPCQRCRPLEPAGAAPGWLTGLLDVVDAEPNRRWTDGELRERGLEPARVRRWFLAHHGLTFHGYLRSRRVGAALGRLKAGADLTETAFDAGFESLSGFRDAFERLFGAPPGRGRGAALARAARILTPLGRMVAVATERGLCLLEFADRRMLETQVARLRRRLGSPIVPGESEVLAATRAELEAYFRGELRRFTLPLAPLGSPFQLVVWEHLAAIPYGATTTYEALARAAGRPGAARATGRAVGDNALAIVLPCHRVVGRDGRLTGYGGGLWRKERLLALERGGPV